MKEENEQTLGQALKQANSNARKRNFEKDVKQRDQAEELKKSLLQQLKELTGEEHYIAKNKDPFAGEPFNQVMHRNLDLLNQIGYLTQAEQSYLFCVQAYLEFRSNVIICREDKFKKKKKYNEDDFDLPRAATVSDIAEMIGKSRRQTSEIMNSLREKEILLNPEGAGQIEENGRTVSPRVWIVNPYIMICAPRKNEVKLDKLTMRLFKHSLKNLKDKDGKKVNLPVRFF
ncbi:Rep protein [Bacillus sp. TL12]|uniref:Rep protein n=1 Tax=Bacillus sp. TL12 TaxID=2894756 RepID=UPI001F51FA2D|nr:Rep protein [Bacillus sp. TL12]MCI0768165.1 Rep protein [Bacillus sp. TL12]